VVAPVAHLSPQATPHSLLAEVVGQQILVLASTAMDSVVVGVLGEQMEVVAQ
jgi:hypothetical protein